MEKEKNSNGCYKYKSTIFPISIFMLIALALNSYALDCDWEQIGGSVANTTLMDGEIINVSYSNAGTTEAAITVYINASSSSTANSTVGTLLRSAANSTGDAGTSASANITFNTQIILEDSPNYVFECACENSTARVDCTTQATSIVVDRTAPSLPTSALPTGKQTSRSQTIQATVIGENTTSCRLTFTSSNPGSATYTMSNTGNNCSQEFSNLAGKTFGYTMSASDGTNRSAETSELSFYVDVAAKSGARKYIAATGGTLPSKASSTAQQRAFGQQAESALDKVIAKAPPEAQQGLTKAKEAVTSQYKGKEAFKTWTGTGAGCVAGFFVVPVIGLIPGCIVGHLVGVVI